MMASITTKIASDEVASGLLVLAAIGLMGVFVLGSNDQSREPTSWLLPVGSLAALVAAALALTANAFHRQNWVAAGTLALVGCTAFVFNIISPLTALVTGFAFATGLAVKFIGKTPQAKHLEAADTVGLQTELAAAISGADVLQIDQRSSVLASNNPAFKVGTALLEHVHVADRPVFLLACANATVTRHLFVARIQSEQGAFFIEKQMWVQSLNGLQFVSIAPLSVKQNPSDDFARELAHELRTPLAAIVGLADALGQPENCTDDMRSSYPSLIASACRNLIEMTGAILESRMSGPSIGPASLGEITSECLALLKPAAQQKSVTLFNRLPAAMAGKIVNGTNLRQIVINLVSNAVKFSQTGASVEISAAISANGWSLSVADNGSGMAPDVIARLGQKNFRGENSAGVAGYGLGLSIVHRMVEEAGARINFESRPGNGTKVVITFPASKLQVLSDFTPQAASALATHSNFNNAAGAKHAAA